jgi:hypothetical protein
VWEPMYPAPPVTKIERLTMYPKVKKSKGMSSNRCV